MSPVAAFRLVLGLLPQGLFVVTICCSERADATEYLDSSAAQIATAMQSAQPGDILTMTNGRWTNQRIQFAGNGTSEAPITLRAQTPGQVVLNALLGSMTELSL